MWWSSPLWIALVFATALSQDWVATLLWLLWHSSQLWLVAWHGISSCLLRGLALQFCPRVVGSSGSRVRKTSFESRFNWQQCSLTTGWPRFLGRSGVQVCFGLCLEPVATLLWLLWHSSQLWFVLGMASAAAYHLGWHCRLVRASWEALAVESASKRALNRASIGNGACSRLGGHASLVIVAFESASGCAWYCTGVCVPLGLASQRCPLMFATALSQDWVATLLWLLWHSESALQG
jgi:hypothetical protein